MVNEFVHADYYLLRWHNSEMLHQAPTSYEEYTRASKVGLVNRKLGVALDEQVNSCESHVTCEIIPSTNSPM